MKQIIERAFALVISFVTLYYFSTFPVFKVPLLIGAFVYIGLLLWRSELWILLIPILLPLLYLTSWSGRLFLTEFDATIALTLAATLWNDHYTVSFGSMRPKIRWLLAAFVLVSLAALFKGLLPLPVLDANSIANYYSNLNSLRVARGLLWALLLYPAWVAQSRVNLKAAHNLLVTGLSLGALAVFLIVLWERNVFYTLIFWTNKYAPIQALLNFSTDYRVTAMFADMHTGGTAIDGYLLLVFPFTALGFLKSRTLPTMGFFAIIFFGILYTSIVTFSRGVYLGIGVALVVTAFLALWQCRYTLKPSNTFALALAFPMLFAAGFVAFRSGGTLPLAYGILAFLATAISIIFRNSSNNSYLISGLGICVLCLTSLSTWSIASREYAFESVPSVLLAAVTILLSAIAGYLFSSKAKLFLSARITIISLTGTALLVGLLTPSLFGSRMGQRFSTVQTDFLHRVEHWQTAINIMDSDLSTTLFGQGLGQFPVTYFWQYQQAKDVGGFIFQKEARNQFLHYLGAHDVRLGQRLSLNPDTNYILSLDVRTNDQKALLYLRACHRQLIHPSEWNPLCVQITKVIESTNGEWRHLELPINTGQVGSLKAFLRAPLIFTVSNRREYQFNLIPQTALDIDNISIRDLFGNEQLTNGDFSSGIDNWFAYYDQNHLPWHVKNIWVYVYFETGLIGLALFVLLIIGSLSTTAKASRDSGMAFTIFVSIIGFLAVGSFGTLIDSPRVASLFYLLLLIGLDCRNFERSPIEQITSDRLRRNHVN